MWEFDHAKETGFALSGAHRKLTCADCHREPPKKVKLKGKKPATTTTRFNGKKQVPTVALPVTWITKANVGKLYADKFIKKSDVCVGEFKKYC